MLKSLARAVPVLALLAVSASAQANDDLNSFVTAKTIRCWTLASMATDDHARSLDPGQTHICLGRDELVAFNSATAWERWQLRCEAGGDDTTVICQAAGTNTYEIALTLDGQVLRVSDHSAGRRLRVFDVIGAFTRPVRAGLEQDVSVLPTTKAHCHATASCIRRANQLLPIPVDVSEAFAENLGSVAGCRGLRLAVVDQLRRARREVPQVCVDEPR